MKVQVHITIQSDEGQAEVVHGVARLERGPLRPDTLGLSLAPSAFDSGRAGANDRRKAAEFVAQGRRCARCGRERAYKGHHGIVFRTPFGKMALDSPQLYRCPCEAAQGSKSVSPLAELLPERTSPELVSIWRRSLRPWCLTD
jgi:ribosomal protein S14